MRITHCVAFLFAAFSLAIQTSVQADTFGGRTTNEFTVDFVSISQTNNAADTTGYGAVPYNYRVGTYEISQLQITKAAQIGMAHVSAGAWTNNQPAANISWYEAAAFVNFLNTNSGKTAAYNLTFTTNWSMAPWSSEQAWTAGGTNLYRNKDAYYFLPSENEWYKAAYYNAAGTNYFLYPTAGNTAPVPVASGTNVGAAVYDQPYEQGPADVNSAGGLSLYGTMGQGGNAMEWMETAADGTNNSPTEVRTIRGGDWATPELFLVSSGDLARGQSDPYLESNGMGFRVASIPEPSTYALLLLGAGAVYAWKRRKRSL
jgi:formylglycine-generating enzyme